jgi:three-Cys-motif partner protein
MAAPKTVTWSLEPHTGAKHAILRRYLAAWLPILSHGNFPEVLYIDAFAGPGTYDGGEDGSPVIALKAFLDQTPSLRCVAHFHFVELDPARAAVLEAQVEELLTQRPNSRIRWKIHRCTFEAAYPAIKTSFGGRSPPTFAFLDPFGWSGLPFSIVRDILSRPSCEVLVNFIYEEINRFLGHPDQEANFQVLFGCDDWREIVRLGGASRNVALRELYARQLRSAAGAEHVRSFEMRNKRDATDYFLFFGTKKLVGLKKMKEAMWKVDEAGAFTFSDATDERQLVLFESKPDLGQLRKQIAAEFAGRVVPVSEIERFVLTDTAFRETHYKGVLKQMELEMPPAISAEGNRRKGQFPDGTRVSFLTASSV